MVFLLMYNLKFPESASKKFGRPQKSGQNQIGESTVAPLRMTTNFRRLLQIISTLEN